MTARPIPCYEIVCDEPECGKKTQDISDFAGWGDIDVAEDEWENADGQTIGERHYCWEHRQPQCFECDTFDRPLIIAPDGQWYCEDCRPDEAND